MPANFADKHSGIATNVAVKSMTESVQRDLRRPNIKTWYVLKCVSFTKKAYFGGDAKGIGDCSWHLWWKHDIVSKHCIMYYASVGDDCVET